LGALSVLPPGLLKLPKKPQLDNKRANSNINKRDAKISVFLFILIKGPYLSDND
jgi:hypothetical protein